MMKYIVIFIVLISSLRCVISQSKEVEPFEIGVINKLQSEILGEERTINIYLPEGYNENDTVSYPVIYLLDGSADEDFVHISGLVQFCSFPWVNFIPKSIVVGIANTERMRDFTFPTDVDMERKSYPSSGHSSEFINFIEKELQPYIKLQYRASNYKTIIGQSLGGLLATEILLERPNLFDRYIIVSPSLWWNNGSILNTKMPLLNGVEVYIGVGKEGLTPSQTPRVMEVDANLLADRVKENLGKNSTALFDYLPEENHATILHQAVYNAFRLFQIKSSESK